MRRNDMNRLFRMMTLALALLLGLFGLAAAESDL